MRFPLGAMSMGDILDRGIKILLARLPTLYVINFVALLPVMALNMVQPFLIDQGDQATAAAATLAFLMGTAFLTLIVKPFASAASLHIVAQEFVGERASAGAACRFALHSFGRLLGASFLAGLAIGVGLMACLVPGIVLAIWYVFTAQVVVVEGRRMTAALERSKQLGQDYRLRIIGLGALVLLIQVGFAIFAFSLQLVLPSYTQVRTPAGIVQTLNPANHVIDTAAAYLVSIIVESFAAVCWTLMYFDLRIRKEGFDLEMAAKQQAADAS